jgi:hypothetical protein
LSSKYPVSGRMRQIDIVGHRPMDASPHMVEHAL